jgi:hypothetical protein
MYLALHYDRQSWLIIDDQGTVVAHNDQIPINEGQRALAWGHGVLAGMPGDLIPLETTYVDDGKAKPCPSVFHDGQGWVITDAEGLVVMRNDDIPPDGDYTVWTEEVFTSRSTPLPGA